MSFLTSYCSEKTLATREAIDESLLHAHCFSYEKKANESLHYKTVNAVHEILSADNIDALRKIFLNTYFYLHIKKALSTALILFMKATSYIS